MNWLKSIDEHPMDAIDLSWDNLAVDSTLLEVIKKEFKFDRLTPIQAAAIPLMLKNKDVIAEAKTGSGKTLAFLVPLVQAILSLDSESTISKYDMLGLILSPTRELASQIHQELRKILRNDLFGDGRRIISHLISGSSNVSADIHKFDKYGGNIIVATPGRLSTIMEMTDNTLSVSIRKKLAFLVFDEADQLLSYDFERDLATILAYLPKQRRTSLFSATQTNEVAELAKSGLRNPIRIDANKLDQGKVRKHDCGNHRTLPMPDKLENFFFVCDTYSNKLAVLCELIRSGKFEKVLVFTSTCAQIDYFSKCVETQLKDNRIKILSLHRRFKNKRKSIYGRFKVSKRCVLLVTDILSRGIDVPDISCVIHLDLPSSPESYVHRSGRSGHQIGLSGISLLLVEPHELDYVEMCRRRDIILEPFKLAHIGHENIHRINKSIVKFFKKAASKQAESGETLAVEAFVSYIRYYSSKMCLRELLFPRLPIGSLVDSFGLVRVPKMPELRKLKSKASNKTSCSDDLTRE